MSKLKKPVSFETPFGVYVVHEKWVNELTEEALRDLLKKYKEKMKGKTDRG